MTEAPYKERRLAWQSYVDATRHLAEASREVGAKMVLVSTDWVFDGTQAPADETTPPNPVNYYGVLKVVGETLVGSLSSNWAVARVASVNGIYWAQPHRPVQQTMGMGNFMKVTVEELKKKRSFTAWEGASKYACHALSGHRCCRDDRQDHQTGSSGNLSLLLQ